VGDGDAELGQLVLNGPISTTSVLVLALKLPMARTAAVLKGFTDAGVVVSDAARVAAVRDGTIVFGIGSWDQLVWGTFYVASKLYAPDDILGGPYSVEYRHYLARVCAQAAAGALLDAACSNPDRRKYLYMYIVSAMGVLNTNGSGAWSNRNSGVVRGMEMGRWPMLKGLLGAGMQSGHVPAERLQQLLIVPIEGLLLEGSWARRVRGEASLRGTGMRGR